jgi:hypothetical protein
MPKIRQGTVNGKKQAMQVAAQVDFVAIIQTAESAKSVTELRTAVGALASAVKALAQATGLWEERRETN